jgi:hypothetical protein
MLQRKLIAERRMLQGLKVLVVEDETVIVMASRLHFRAHACHVRRGDFVPYLKHEEIRPR